MNDRSRISGDIAYTILAVTENKSPPLHDKGRTSFPLHDKRENLIFLHDKHYFYMINGGVEISYMINFIMTNYVTIWYEDLNILF